MSDAGKCERTRVWSNIADGYKGWNDQAQRKNTHKLVPSARDKLEVGSSDDQTILTHVKPALGQLAS